MFARFWRGIAGRPGLAAIILAALLLPALSPAAAYAAPIRLTGNGQVINNNDAVPDTADGTDFGQAVFNGSGNGEQVTHTFAVHNDGAAAFTVLQVRITMIGGVTGEFTVNPTTSFTVPAGESRDFDIVFSPQRELNRNAQVFVGSDTAGSILFNITGEGIAAPTPPPAMIEVSGNGQTISLGDTTPDVNDGTDFGLVNIANGTSSRTFTISNPGTGDLNLGPNAASLAGFYAADFKITSQPAETVAPGSSTTVTVEFDPDDTQSPGAVPDRRAQLRIANNVTGFFSFDIEGHAGDLDAPTVAISGVPTTANGPFTVTFTFSEGVLGFDIGDIAVGNGATSDFTAVNASVYTALITPVAAGVVTIDVAAGVAQDFSGNDNVAAAPSSATYDDSAPSVFIIGAPASIANLNPFPVTIRFSEPVTGFIVGDISVGNGSASGLTGSGDTYQASISPSGRGDLTLDIAAGVAQDADLNGNIAAARVVVGLDLIGETRARIAEFLLNRGNHILQNQPNLIGFVNGTHGGGGGPWGSLKSSFDEERVSLAFATSLSKLLGGNGGSTSVATSDAGSENPDTRPGSRFGAASPHKFDVWAALYGSAGSSGNADSSFWVGYLGAHYFLSRDLLIGGLVQADWAEEGNDTAGSDASGFGWLAGPYIAGRVPGENLYYEARAAWGRSYNDIDPFGAYSDDFQTSRWLVRAKIAGVFEVGRWSIIPEASFAWFQETQDAYTDSLGNRIEDQTVSLGEVRFGPKVGYDFALDNGGIVSPSAGLSGVWNFGIRENAASSGFPLNDHDLRARLDAGLDVHLPGGWMLAGEGYIDGLGAHDYEAYGGKVRMTVPIQ